MDSQTVKLFIIKMWKNCHCRCIISFATIEKEGSGRNLSNTTLEFNCVYCWELYVSKCINISKDLRKCVACVLQKHYRKVQIIYFKELENSCLLKIFAQNLQNRLNQKSVWFTNCCFYSSCLGAISKISRLHNWHKTQCLFTLY